MCNLYIQGNTDNSWLRAQYWQKDFLNEPGKTKITRGSNSYVSVRSGIEGPVFDKSTGRGLKGNFICNLKTSTCRKYIWTEGTSSQIDDKEYTDLGYIQDVDTYKSYPETTLNIRPYRRNFRSSTLPIPALPLNHWVMAPSVYDDPLVAFTYLPVYPEVSFKSHILAIF